MVIPKIDKNILKQFLSKRELKEPHYVENHRKEKDIEKWLDWKLLWYNVEVLSSAGSIFSGVPAFIATLAGIVNLSEDKILVKIFKHPVMKNEHNYSFGILIPAFGTSGLTDYSGWLIFYDCATDYSGFGGSLYIQAKNFIDKFRKYNAIEAEEIKVNKKVFQKYLKRKSASSVFDRIVTQTPFGPKALEDISKIESTKKLFIENTRGILFELIVYKWIIMTQDFDEIKHDHIINGEQIDIFYKKRIKYTFSNVA